MCGRRESLKRQSQLNWRRAEGTAPVEAAEIDPTGRGSGLRLELAGVLRKETNDIIRKTFELSHPMIMLTVC